MSIFGTVTHWDTGKGFGFIRPDAPSQRDVFIHASAVKALGICTLEKGMRVEFDVAPDLRDSHRLRAHYLKLARTA